MEALLNLLNGMQIDKTPDSTKMKTTQYNRTSSTIKNKQSTFYGATELLETIWPVRIV